MCLIVYDKHESGKPMPFEIVQKGMEQNPNLSGYAFSSADNRLVVRRPFKDAKKLYARYKKDVEENPNRPFILHFRQATHGKVDTVNTQPLKISKDLIMAHNGILDMGCLPTEEISDSVTFARALAANGFTDLDTLKDKKFLLIRSSRLIFMDAEGKVLFVNEQGGSWDDERWFSTRNPANITGGFKAWRTRKGNSRTTCDKCLEAVSKTHWIDYAIPGNGKFLCNECIESSKVPIVKCGTCKVLTTSASKKGKEHQCYVCLRKPSSGSSYWYKCTECKQSVRNVKKYEKNDNLVCPTCYHKGGSIADKVCEECSEVKWSLYTIAGKEVCLACKDKITKPKCPKCEEESYVAIYSSTNLVCSSCWAKEKEAN